MSELNPNSYWQRKATYQNVKKHIPDFSELESGQTKKYYDKDGNLHFEIRVSQNEHLETSFSKLVDYIQGEATSIKPSPQIIQQNSLHEVSTYLMAALLDCFARATVGYGLNEIYNSHNDVTLIDHKNNEVHRFSGSVKNEQLRFETTHNMDEDLMAKDRLGAKYSQDERVSRDFTGLLSKLTPSFKARFSNEEQAIEIS